MSDQNEKLGRVGRGSLTGRWEPGPGAGPNIRGGITLERALRAKTKLWLTGVDQDDRRRPVRVGPVEIADEGGRRNR